MQSLVNIMYKLQTALKVKGYIVVINTQQFYSPQQDRFVKMYILKHNKKEIECSASQIVIVKTLKQMLDCVEELEAMRVPRQEWASAVLESVRTNFKKLHDK